MSTVPDRVPEGPIRLTYDDYVELPDDGKCYEVLDGELYVTPAPRPRHQAVSRNLQRILDNHIVEHRLGTLYDAPIDLILSDTTIAQPALLFIRAGRESIITDRAVEGPPDLVVEILSPSTRRKDRVTKAALYASFGIGEYWIVDPDEETIDIYERAGSTFTRRARHTQSDRFVTRVFPHLELDLAELWSRP